MCIFSLIVHFSIWFVSKCPSEQLSRWATILKVPILCHSPFSSLLHFRHIKLIYTIQINSTTIITLISCKALSVDCDVAKLRQFDS